MEKWKVEQKKNEEQNLKTKFLKNIYIFSKITGEAENPLKSK